MSKETIGSMAQSLYVDHRIQVRRLSEIPRACDSKQGLSLSFSLVCEPHIYAEPLSLTFTSYLILVTLRVTMLTIPSCNLTVMLGNVPAPNSANLNKNPVSSHHWLASKCPSWFYPGPMTSPQPLSAC